MSKRSVSLLLQDILDSANKITRYTHNLSYKDFELDEKTIDAVVRNFEVIGEAANRLPNEVKEHYTTIDWFRLRGFRTGLLMIIWELICR